MRLFKGQVEIRETDTIKVYQDYLTVFDKNKKETYYENSDEYWSKQEFDKNGNETYYENSNKYWAKREFDENNNRTYFENSYGKIIDNRLKEMTPLEALEKLTSNEPMTAEEFDNSVEIIKSSLLKLDSLEKFKATFDRYELAKKQDFIAYENWLECEAELKKSPTVDEVCKALSEYYGKEVKVDKRYKNTTFVCDGKNIAWVDNNGSVQINQPKPPHLITLIGRFYEGEIK